MTFVEPGLDGLYPEHYMNTPRARLQDIWRRLADCETTFDPRALERARSEAALALDYAIHNALQRGGMDLVAPVMRDVDFRGWH